MTKGLKYARHLCRLQALAWLLALKDKIEQLVIWKLKQTGKPVVFLLQKSPVPGFKKLGKQQIVFKQATTRAPLYAAETLFIHKDCVTVCRAF
jgi:hypothetical protein